MTATKQAISAAPCGKCPFRMDVPIYLRSVRRAEIARTLIDGYDFHCHATVAWSDDEDETADLSEAVICAGATKALLAIGASTNMMRIAERLGMADLDRTKDRGPDCWDLDTWQRLAEGSTGDNPEEEPGIETCNTVNADCLAPAGYMGSGGGVISGTEAADLECPSCGEPVCSACADDEGLCGNCAEWGEDE